MFFSMTTFLNTIFFCSVFILLLWIYLRDNNLITLAWIKAIFLFIIIIVARLLFPIEFHFSNTIASKNILPGLYSILRTPIFSLGKYNINLKQILYLIWGIGTIFYLTRAIIIYYNFKRKILNYPEIKDEKIHNILHDVSQSYKKHVTYKIIQTDIVSTPGLLGIRNPAIIVPPIDFSEDEWHYIFFHEVTHYHNYHLWIKIIVEVLCSCYWWNPIIFLFRKVVNTSLEIYVDFIVTKKLDEFQKIGYLECLLKVAKQRTDNHTINTLLTLESKDSSILLQRFNIIIEGSIIKRKSNYKYTFLLLVPMLLVLVFSFTIVFEPYYIAPQDASDTFAITKEASYLVHNPEGGYDLYINNKYIATVNDILDSYSDLTIYKNFKEAVNNEKTQ